MNKCGQGCGYAVDIVVHKEVMGVDKSNPSVHKNVMLVDTLLMSMRMCIGVGIGIGHQRMEGIGIGVRMKGRSMSYRSMDRGMCIGVGRYRDRRYRQ